MKEKFLDEKHVFLVQYSDRNVINIDQDEGNQISLWQKHSIKKTNSIKKTSTPNTTAQNALSTFVKLKFNNVFKNNSITPRTKDPLSSTDIEDINHTSNNIDSSRNIFNLKAGFDNKN